MLGRDQLSSHKYEELLGILIDRKWVFEDQFLNIETCRRTTPPLTQMIFVADFY